MVCDTDRSEQSASRLKRVVKHLKKLSKKLSNFSALKKTLEKTLEFFRTKTLETLEKTFEKKRSVPDVFRPLSDHLATPGCPIDIYF